MGHNKFFASMGRWLISVLHLQLFLTLVSWPILIFWGLPLSIMSPVGNLIFSPIATLFLLLSSFIFFCELVRIPNGFLIFLLEKLTAFWLKIIHLASPRWLMGMPLAYSFFLVLIPFFAVGILYFRPLKLPIKNFLALCALFAFTVIILVVGKESSVSPHYIPGSRGQKLALYAGQQKALIVQSTGIQAKGLSDWVEYTLRPELIKIDGSPEINYLIVSKPHKSAFELGQALLDQKMIEHICIKTWTIWLDSQVYFAYKKMLEMGKEQKIPLTYYQDKLKVNLGPFLLEL